MGRQRRIVGNAAKNLAPGGHLLYSTCTYNIKENEKVVEWLCAEYPQLSPVTVHHLEPYRSRYSQLPCYRLFPHQGLGAGAFVALLANNAEHATGDVQEVIYRWRFGQPPTTPKQD